jgi:hypothetical protein
VNVAKTGLWAEIQRERARQQRFRAQEFRALRQAGERAERERVKAQKAAARKAAVDLKEAKRLYLEDRRAEAAEMAQLLENRVNELDNVLTVAPARPDAVRGTRTCQEFLQSAPDVDLDVSRSALPARSLDQSVALCERPV